MLAANLSLRRGCTSAEVGANYPSSCMCTCRYCNRTAAPVLTRLQTLHSIECQRLASSVFSSFLPDVRGHRSCTQLGKTQGQTAGTKQLRWIKARSQRQLPPIAVLLRSCADSLAAGGPERLASNARAGRLAGNMTPVQLQNRLSKTGGGSGNVFLLRKSQQQPTQSRHSCAHVTRKPPRSPQSMSFASSQMARIPV